MTRFKDILNSINDSVTKGAGEMYGGKKRSDLKDSDFLFPESRSFPIVTPQDIPDAISNFGRMKGNMSYDAFLKKLYNMAKRKGPEFVAALPEATKEKLGLKKKVAAETEDLEDYKESFYSMSVSSLNAIMNHTKDILDNLENPAVKENLTAAHLQGMIAVAEDSLRNIHDFVMFTEVEDDTTEVEDETESSVDQINPKKEKKKKKISVKDLPKHTYVINQTPSEDLMEEDMMTDTSMSGDKPGLWDNIRKKKERMGKNYKPAKPGDKGRPDPEQWDKLTK